MKKNKKQQSPEMHFTERTQ